MLQQFLNQECEIRGGTMKGYKNESLVVIETDLKRCRELKSLIDAERYKKDTVSHIHSKLGGEGDIEDKALTDLLQERDRLINKYLLAIVGLKEREKIIIMAYYIDGCGIKQIAAELRVQERQIVYSKKRALEKLSAY